MAKPKTIGRSYAHKLYMSTTGYPEAIGRPGDKDYDNYTKRPHSDDKKPYYPDEYSEMEHYWTPRDPPNFVPPGIPDDPRIPPMNPNQPPDIEDGPDKPPGESDFTGCIFTWLSGPTTLRVGDTTFRSIGVQPDDPLVRLYVNYGPVKLLATTVKSVMACVVGPYPNCTVRAIAIAFNPAEHTEHEVADDTYAAQIVGVTAAGFTCAWDLEVTNCPPTVEFEWDSDNSAETIADNSTVGIYVTGGAPPFTWALTGAEGFSLSHKVTDDRNNSLIADADGACGAADIVVVDACDNTVEASIRNPGRGQWVSKGAICGYAGYDSSWVKSGLTYGVFFSYAGEVISGKQKQTQVVRYLHSDPQFSVSRMETEGECDEHRSSHDLGTLISECLGWVSPIWVGSTIGWRYRIAGRKYASNCSFSQKLFDLGWNAWTYGYGHMDEEPTSLEYFEWECVA